MKRRLLLVDDELAILLTLKAILELNGFEVDTAESAKEAEQRLRGGEYHMVITDMKMEHDRAGYEVIQRFYEIGSPAGLAELDRLLSERSR